MSDPSTFFVSRAGSDRNVAVQIAQMIRDAGGETILQDESFGHAAFMGRMHDGMQTMDRMVVLLSKAYQESDYCLAECFHVLASDPLNKAERLVVLKIEDCDAVGMLRGLAYTAYRRDKNGVGGQVTITSTFTSINSTGATCNAANNTEPKYVPKTDSANERAVAKHWQIVIPVFNEPWLPERVVGNGTYAGLAACATASAGCDDPDC